MSALFLNVPPHSLCDYLSNDDIVNLSRTSRLLRDVYLPLSWRWCKLYVEESESLIQSASLTRSRRSSSNVFRYQRPRSSSSLSVSSFKSKASEPTKPSCPHTSGNSKYRCIPDKIFFNPQRYSWFCNSSVVEIDIVKLPQPQWQVRTRPQTPALTPNQSITGLQTFAASLSMTQHESISESNSPIERPDLLHWADVVNDDFAWDTHFQTFFPVVYKVKFPKAIVLSSIPTWFKQQPSKLVLENPSREIGVQMLVDFEFWVCASESGLYFGDDIQTNGIIGSSISYLSDPQEMAQQQQYHQLEQLADINTDHITGVTISSITNGQVLPLPLVLKNLKHIEVTCQSIINIMDLVTQCKEGTFPKLESLDINFNLSKINRTGDRPRVLEPNELLQDLSLLLVPQEEEEGDVDRDIDLQSPKLQSPQFEIPAINISFIEQSKESMIGGGDDLNTTVSHPHFTITNPPPINPRIYIPELQSLRFENSLKLNSHVNVLGLPGMANLKVLEIGLENFTSLDPENQVFQQLEVLNLHLNCLNTPMDLVISRMQSFAEQEFCSLKKLIVQGAGESWFYATTKDADHLAKADHIEVTQLGVAIVPFLKGIWEKFIRHPDFSPEQTDVIRNYIEKEFAALVSDQTTSNMFKNWNEEDKREKTLDLLVGMVQNPLRNIQNMLPFTFTWFNFDFAIYYIWETLFHIIGHKMKSLEYLSLLTPLPVYSSPRLRELLLCVPENDTDDPTETAVSFFGCPQLKQAMLTTCLRCDSEINVLEGTEVDVGSSCVYHEWYLREDVEPTQRRFTSPIDERHYALYSVWDAEAERYEFERKLAVKQVVKESLDTNFRTRVFCKDRSKPFDYEYMYSPEFCGWI